MLTPLLPSCQICFTSSRTMLVKEPAGWTKKGGFYSNLLLILSFTGNKQDWPKAKNKLFIWVSQQRRIYFYNTRLQQTFPEANEISFNSGLLKVILEDDITWVSYTGFLSKSYLQLKSHLAIYREIFKKAQMYLMFTLYTMRIKKPKHSNYVFSLQLFL